MGTPAVGSCVDMLAISITCVGEEEGAWSFVLPR